MHTADLFKIMPVKAVLLQKIPKHTFYTLHLYSQQCEKSSFIAGHLSTQKWHF